MAYTSRNRSKPEYPYNVFFHIGPEGSRYEDNLAKSVWNPVDLAKLTRHLGKPTLDRIAANGSGVVVPVWGIEPGEGEDNVDTWVQAAVDDLVLIILQDTVVAGGRVLDTWRSKAAAEQIWGPPTNRASWECCIALRNLTKYNIPKSDVQGWLKYQKKPQAIQGYMRVSETRDVRPLLDGLKANGGLP